MCTTMFIVQSVQDVALSWRMVANPTVIEVEAITFLGRVICQGSSTNTSEILNSLIFQAILLLCRFIGQGPSTNTWGFMN